MDQSPQSPPSLAGLPKPAPFHIQLAVPSQCLGLTNPVPTTAHLLLFFDGLIPWVNSHPLGGLRRAIHDQHLPSRSCRSQ